MSDAVQLAKASSLMIRKLTAEPATRHSDSASQSKRGKRKAGTLTGNT